MYDMVDALRGLLGNVEDIGDGCDDAKCSGEDIDLEGAGER